MTQSVQSLLNHQFARFLFVGLLNTVVGYCLYAVLWALLDLAPALANALAYGIAVLVAFFFYRGLVFGGAEGGLGPQLARFLLCFAAAFALNQGVLYALYGIANIHPLVAQIFAMATYTVSFFLLNKHIVFASD